MEKDKFMLHEILTFVSESPFLTFFIALIVFGAVVEIFKYISYAIRGDPNIIKNNDDDDDDDD
jgi:Na+/citrate or Na+/malate symporter